MEERRFLLRETYQLSTKFTVLHGSGILLNHQLHCIPWHKDYRDSHAVPIITRHGDASYYINGIPPPFFNHPTQLPAAHQSPWEPPAQPSPSSVLYFSSICFSASHRLLRESPIGRALDPGSCCCCLMEQSPSRLWLQSVQAWGGCHRASRIRAITRRTEIKLEGEDRKDSLPVIL